MEFRTNKTQADILDPAPCTMQHINVSDRIKCISSIGLVHCSFWA
jgi:hypothetical protein